jgi:hypothetical protein
MGSTLGSAFAAPIGIGRRKAKPQPIVSSQFEMFSNQNVPDFSRNIFVITKATVDISMNRP